MHGRIEGNPHLGLQPWQPGQHEGRLPGGQPAGGLAACQRPASRLLGCASSELLPPCAICCTPSTAVQPFRILAAALNNPWECGMHHDGAPKHACHADAALAAAHVVIHARPTCWRDEMCLVAGVIRSRMAHCASPCSTDELSNSGASHNASLTHKLMSCMKIPE